MMKDNMNDKQAVVEEIMGDAGFRICWSYSETWVDVEVFEIVATNEDGAKFFAAKGAVGSEDLTEDVNEAEPYLSGFIKWDGCTELDQNCPHWCGPFYYKKHIKLLEYLYGRAFELMKREPLEKWDDINTPE